MLKRLALSLLLLLLIGLLPVCLSAREKRFGYCQTQLAGTRVKTCTVEVFITGTLTHPTQIYQDNIGTPLGNPFTASSSTGLWFFYADNARYDVKFSGGTPTISPPYTLSDLLFIDIGDVVSFSAQYFQSSAANSAQSGVMRLASSDVIAWRNAANSADVIFQKQGAAILNLPADTFNIGTGGAGGLQAVFLSNTSNNMALAGALRLVRSDSICWRNDAGSADACLSKNTSDLLAFNGALVPNLASTQTWTGTNTFGTIIPTTITSGCANSALSGTLRLCNTDSINFRNGANTGDLSALKVNSLDDISMIPGATSIIGLLSDFITVGRQALNVTFQISQSHANGEGFVVRANDGLAAGNGGGSIAITAGGGIGTGGGGSVTLTPGNSGTGTGGIVRIAVLPVFARLPACAAGTEGGLIPISDSTTTTWGATITGGSTNHVLAYCDGVAWTVAAK